MYLLKCFAFFALSRSNPCSSSSSNGGSLTGIITSQDGGDTEYASRISCKWEISGINEDDVVKFTVLEFNTECGYDFLNIYDGLAPIDSKTIARLCGKRNIEMGNNMVFISNGNIAVLTFRTDSFVVRSGFRIRYDIISRTKICTSRSDCSNHGSCDGGQCNCDSGFSGLVCQTNAALSPFVARQKHSITFIESMDIAIVTFGRNFHTTIDDMAFYNFTTSSWRVLNSSGWSILPRYDHLTFWVNSKLILYGGQNTNQNVFGDLWEYDINGNTWSQITGIRGPAPLLFEPTVVIIPFLTEFRIFVTGGITRSGTINMKMYSYDSVSRQWIDLGFTPVSYQGGSGVYHPETNSINFALTGYPNYDSSYSEEKIYSWKYSISSNVWSPMGSRTPADILYIGKSIYDSSTETALVHGGLNLNSQERCFESRLWQFDLACKTWDLLASVIVPRAAHGIIKRGSSLWIFGGYEGVLEGDVKEIPIVPLLQSQSVRNQCRAKNYCSFITECDSCILQPGCVWCNDACGFDDKSSPLSTTIEQEIGNVVQGYLPNGVCGRFNGTSTCPSRTILETSKAYKFDIKYQTFQDYYYYWDETLFAVEVSTRIDSVTPANTQLRITYMDKLPFPVTTLSGQSTVQIFFPQRKYTRIRVSWDNSFGIPVPTTIDQNLSSIISNNDQGLTAEFTIQVSSSAVSTEYPLELTDYVIIFFLALAVLLALTGIAQWIRSFRTNRRNSQALIIAGPTPQLYAYSFVGKGLVPISVERISAEGKVIIAQTYLVLLPRIGELPEMSFGTFVRVEETETSGLKSLNESEEGIMLKVRQSRPFGNS